MNSDNPNIFRIGSSGLGPEDRFTSFLHYLVDSVPGVGQSLVNVFVSLSGLKSAVFQLAIDHPNGDAENRPDFMLRCDEYDILCEHKLDSDLGNLQLERYLSLPKDRPTFLALISGREHAISSEVANSEYYLQPHSSAVQHFYWEDLYPAISGHTDRLSQDFLRYMRDLGMSPNLLPQDWDGLFNSVDVAERFYEHTRDMRVHFESFGAMCKADPSRRGIQVQHPNEWIHLLYISLDKVAKPVIPVIEPPYMTARIFARKDGALGLAAKSEEIKTPSGTLLVRPKEEIASWNSDLVLRYEVIGSLVSHIGRNALETRSRLLDFGKAVLNNFHAES
jgi:hypothetical protein